MHILEIAEFLYAEPDCMMNRMKTRKKPSLSNMDYYDYKYQNLKYRFSKHVLANLPGGYALPPVNFNLLVTYRCNIKCNFCYLYENNTRENEEKEMSLNEIKKIIDEISRFKPSIYITGGEPLLYRHITEVVKYIKEKGCYCGLFTNGLLLNEKIAEELVDSKLNNICISLGGTKHVHENARNMPGSFEKAIKAIKLMKRITNEKKSSFPKIGLFCTISKENEGVLYDLLPIAKKLEADILTYKHLYFSRDNMIKRHNEKFRRYFGIDAEGISKTGIEVGVDAAKVIEQMKKINKDQGIKKKFYPNFSLDEVFKYYSDCAYPLRKRCFFPWFSASIKPNGDLSVCFHNYVVGNLKNKSFRELWNNKKARHFRKVIQKEKTFPACTRCGGLFRYG